MKIAPTITDSTLRTTNEDDEIVDADEKLCFTIYGSSFNCRQRD